MTTRIRLAAAGILVLVVVAGLSSVGGHAQEQPRRGEEPTPVPKPTETPRGMDMLDAASILEKIDRPASIDSMIQWMTALIAESQALSKSFGELAGLHHGADKSEILMMQRMSDAMGTMAGEIKMSLKQYNALVEDETASVDATMRAEVQSFKGVMDVMANEIVQAIETLRRLQAQLGQG